MKTSERIALIYGLSAIGAGAVSYYRGRRGQELLLDTALHGAVAGTALNVVGWVLLESGELSATPVLALSNFSSAAKDVGKLTAEGKELLTRLNVSELYKDFKGGGLMIAEVPENPGTVVQGDF